MAPELVGKGKYDQSVDLWCAGVVLYELLTCDTPFRDPDGDPNKTRLLIKNTKLENTELWNDIQPNFQEFLLVILEKDRLKRAKAADLQNHRLFKPYIEKFDKMLYGINDNLHPNNKEKDFDDIHCF